MSPGATIVGGDWAEAATRVLSAEGHRAGGARGAVIELLSRQSCCLSAQEIADRLRGSRTKVGLASVYRALDLLHEMALVQRVDLGDGGARYEPIRPGGEHHHHAVCDRCGRVTAFEDARLERDLERLGRHLRHTVSTHELVLHGACSRCVEAG